MRSDRYKDESSYQAPARSERERVPEPVIHNQRAKKKKSKAPLIILLIIVFLAGAGVGGYYYYSHYMKAIKVDVWSLIEEPSFSGVESEGVANPIVLDQKKVKKFIKKTESKYTADRAAKLNAVLQKMTFEVTPKEKLSNKTSVDVVCNYDAKAADNGSFVFNMKDGKNVSPMSKTYVVKGLKSQATDSEILDSFKDRANGTISGSTYEKFYKLTKGTESRYVIILSVKNEGKLNYRCLMTEVVTPTNALTVGFSEYKIGDGITDHNQFVASFKEKGYNVTAM